MPSSSRCSVASSNDVQLLGDRQAEATSVAEFLGTLQSPNANSILHPFVPLPLPHRVCVHPRSRVVV